MDGLSQPVYTQAIPAEGSQPSQPADASQAAPPSSFTQAPVASAPAPVVTAPEAAILPPPPPAISASSAPQQPGQSLLHPFPEQDPAALPLTGFASVPARAAVLPNAQPYTRPTPYEPPAVELGAGLSRDPPIRRFISDAEVKASQTNGMGDLVRTPGVVHDDEVQSLSVEQLKKMGLGRVPSGAWLGSSLSYFAAPCVKELTSRCHSHVRTGFCFSARMTLHAPLPRTVNENDPHPEQPARITGIYNKLLSALCVCSSRVI